MTLLEGPFTATLSSPQVRLQSAMWMLLPAGSMQSRFLEEDVYGLLIVTYKKDETRRSTLVFQAKDGSSSIHSFSLTFSILSKRENLLDNVRLMSETNASQSISSFIVTVLSINFCYVMVRCMMVRCRFERCRSAWAPGSAWGSWWAWYRKSPRLYSDRNRSAK